jgi:hypothetical protein
MLNSHDQEITLNNIFEIRNRSALQVAEKPETKPRKNIMKVLNLT